MNDLSAHILVVDDDPRICRLLSRYLSKEGCRVSTAANGHEMQRVLDEGGVELLILDLGLPGEDGLSIARRLRSRSELGIIMLTGKSEVVDKVVGLEVGADDYITKPFDNRELLARVRSVLRRVQDAPPKPEESGRIARFSGLSLNLDTNELVSGRGEQIYLTHAEFKLLSAFVTHANRVLTRDNLLDHVADRGWQPFDRSIDVLVGKLRRKIEQDPKHPVMIQAVRGMGYKFAANVKFL